MDTIKGWFSKSETKMLGYDSDHQRATESQHYSDDAKAHMNERIVDEDEE